MLKRFGKSIWNQSREMRVINYSEHIVYELYTNQGYIYVAHDKSTQKIEVLNGIPNSFQSYEDSDTRTHKKETFLTPNMQ